MFDNLREDSRRLREIKSKPFPWYVLESLLFENGYQAVVLYRASHWFRSRKVPFFGPLFHRLSILLTGVDIAPASEIGPGLVIGHGIGLVVGDKVRIGSGATLLHQVTIGSPSRSRGHEMPILGDGVFVGAGSRLIGQIEIGDRVFIGVNSIVAKDIPSDCTVGSTAEIEIRPRARNKNETDEAPVNETQ